MSLLPDARRRPAPPAAQGWRRASGSRRVRRRVAMVRWWLRLTAASSRKNMDHRKSSIVNRTTPRKHGRFDLLVIDLDGTLLNRGRLVSPQNQAAIHAARHAGIEVIIATGRSLKESHRAIEALDHQGLVVAAGGSLLCDAATGATIDRRVIPHEIVQCVTSALIGDGHKVLILKDSHVTGYDYVVVGAGDLDPASQWWFDHLPVEVKHIDRLEDDFHPEDTLRAGAVAGHDRIAPIAAALRQSIGDRC